MRLAVLSDIHGNLTALEAALADLAAQGGADHTWFLGDFALFGPRPAESVARVRAMFDAVTDDEAKKHTLRAIRGNTDRYVVYGMLPKATAAKDAESLDKFRADVHNFAARHEWCLAQLSFEDYDFLHKLPGETDLHAEDYGYVIGYHGIPGDDEGNTLTPTSSEDEATDALLDREGTLGIGGHIHVQMDRPVGAWRIVNVGSIGISFDNPGKAQYGIFTFENGEVNVDLRAVPYDVEAVIAVSRQRGNPATDWLAGKLRG
jgi:predicted phosphodiesterase